jgi:hypothetical protein
MYCQAMFSSIAAIVRIITACMRTFFEHLLKVRKKAENLVPIWKDKWVMFV